MPRLNKFKTVKKILGTKNLIIFFDNETRYNVAAEGNKKMIIALIREIMVGSENIRKIVLAAIDSAFENINKLKEEE
jgi:hypothetical protein